MNHSLFTVQTVCGKGLKPTSRSPGSRRFSDFRKEKKQERRKTEGWSDTQEVKVFLPEPEMPKMLP